MDNQLWELFLETGDPMGYLLFRAECGEKPEPDRKKNQNQKRKPKEGQKLSM